MKRSCYFIVIPFKIFRVKKSIRNSYWAGSQVATRMMAICNKVSILELGQNVTLHFLADLGPMSTKFDFMLCTNDGFRYWSLSCSIGQYTHQCSDKSVGI